jgi:hypothetical protein
MFQANKLNITLMHNFIGTLLALYKLAPNLSKLNAGTIPYVLVVTWITA